MKTLLTLALFAMLFATGCSTLDVETDRIYYETKYDAQSKDVQLQASPHDCEYSTAPLGNKNCHYERQVFVTKHGVNTLNQPIVSYDDWKTWQLEDRTGTGHAATDWYNEVQTSWQKVAD